MSCALFLLFTIPGVAEVARLQGKELAMGADSSGVNRRQMMRGIGGALALTPLVPWLLGAAEPFNASGVLSQGQPEDAGMSSEGIEDVFARLKQRVNDGLFPGATALIARHGVIVGQRAFGS